jgi:hypothetical protein
MPTAAKMTNLGTPPALAAVAPAAEAAAPAAEKTAAPTLPRPRKRMAPTLDAAAQLCGQGGADAGAVSDSAECGRHATTAPHVPGSLRRGARRRQAHGARRQAAAGQGALGAQARGGACAHRRQCRARVSARKQCVCVCGAGRARSRSVVRRARHGAAIRAAPARACSHHDRTRVRDAQCGAAVRRRGVMPGLFLAASRVGSMVCVLVTHRTARRAAARPRARRRTGRTWLRACELRACAWRAGRERGGEAIWSDFAHDSPNFYNILGPR